MSEHEIRNIKYAILETMRYAGYSINSKEYNHISRMLFPVVKWERPMAPIGILKEK